MKRKWLVLTGLSIIAELCLLLHLPTVMLAFMFMIGRSDCSFEKTLSTLTFESQFYEYRGEMARSIRLIEREGDLEHWATPHGRFWVPAGGGPERSHVLAEQHLNIYGPVHPGEVVIDCGADVGHFTRTALDRGASLVIAVEPISVLVYCLQRNFQREIAEGSVTVCRKGVWNRFDKLPLYYEGATLLAPQRPSAFEVVQLTTIDNIVDELRLKRVDMIKMDIEGAEKQALQGARKTLLKHKPRLAISCEHSPSDATEISRLVESIVPGYVKECGPCVHFGNHLQPFVLYFH